MPTTYKVLGQVVTTAPTTAAVTANIIPNSTFTANTGPTTSIATGVTAYGVVPGIPTDQVKKWTCDNTGSNAPAGWWLGTAFTSNNSTTSGGSVDREALVFRVTGGSATNEIMFRHGTTANTTNTTTTAGYALETGVVHYLGVNFQPHTNQCNARIRIFKHDSSGVIQTTEDTATVTAAAGNWARVTGSFTPSSNYPLYTFGVLAGSPADSGNWGVYVDNLTVSTASPYGTTYPDIAGTDWTGTTAGAVSPFNIKLKGLESGVQSNTVLSYYGDLIDLYTVPTATSTVASTLTITNMNSSAGTFRVAVVPSGQTVSKKNFVFFNVAIAANSTQTVTIGQTLAAGDKIKVSAENDLVSFSLFGSELS